MMGLRGSSKITEMCGIDRGGCQVLQRLSQKLPSTEMFVTPL